MKTLVLILFTIGLCLAADTTAEDSSTTLKLRLLPSSDSQQVSVKPTDGAVDTAVVEIKEQNGQWRLMTLAHRGYWSYTAASSMMGLRFPLSFRLTSVNGEQITLRNAVAMLLGRDVVFDSHTQYSGGTSEPTSEPTSAPTSEPTSEPTSVPTSEPTGTAKPKPPKPTSVPTNTPTSAPTDAPTQAPTDAPTDAPTTQTPTDAPTTAPTEPAPTEPPTAAPTAPQTVPPTTAPTEPQQTTPRPTEPAPTEPPTTTAPTDTPTTEPDVPTQEPSALPTEVPPTEAPATEAPATEAPATEAPATEAPATEAPATEAPTEAPTEPATEAPTEAPATEAPTEAPTQPATEAPTQTPTEAATEAPATGTDAPTQGSSSCSTKTKVMVPLYVYPGAAWDALITGAQYAQTVAIINPYNGPRPTPDSAYTTYMQKFHDAGIDLVGYVYTQYGNRDINVVKADINTYAQNYPYVVGIFLDEAAADASKLPYYQELYNYIMGFPGYKYDVINPGIIPDYGYLGASTQIVSFENYGSVAASTSAPSYGNCNNKEHFVAIAHTIGSGDMRTIVDQLDRMDYFGYIYVTDGAGGCCTYNNLCSYYVDSAQYIGSL